MTQRLSLSLHNVKKDAENAVLTVDKFIEDAFHRTKVNSMLLLAGETFAQHDATFATMKECLSKLKELRKLHEELIKQV